MWERAGGGDQDVGILMTASSDRTLGNVATGNNIQALSLAGTGDIVGTNMQ